MEERGIRKVKLTSEMKNSFMQYAMSVIVSRALPDVRDGLTSSATNNLWNE